MRLMTTEEWELLDKAVELYHDAGLDIVPVALALHLKMSERQQKELEEMSLEEV